MRATLVFLFLILAKGETSAQSLPSVFPFKTRKTINIGVFFVRDNPRVVNYAIEPIQASKKHEHEDNPKMTPTLLVKPAQT
ncbi:hypothetical protein Y032_0004g1740 [Ancylostoma ceylanicum]|uniref:Uncharacterized protein n=1 Tax=Ancylostoma ceylanicum TaxID=53326 RepID=A0A016VVE3_9BILA|nr:hypothetical protein Y032_0004g1740 [Ancylostoma ceylanicum]